MNRRTAFKNLVLASGTFITLPSWVVAIGLADKPGFETSFTQEEQRVLSAVADTIIPAGSAIGAISVGVDKYLLKVFDDCYEPKITTAIKKQLHNLEGSAVTAYSKSYTDLSYGLRLQVLLKLSTSSLKEDQDFFKTDQIRNNPRF